MRSLLLLLLAARAAYGQGALTGGDFELRQHGLIPGGESSAETSGELMTLKSFERPFTAPSYPLADSEAGQLMPPPWGFNLYSRLADNQIPSPTTQDAISVGKFAAHEDFDFFFNVSPMNAPMRVDSARIARANDLLSATVGPQAALVQDRVVELNLMLESGGFQESLAQNVVLEMPYRDADGDGAVDGSNPPIRARTLAIYTLDEARGAWVRVAGSTVDLVNRKVRAAFPHLSVYALIGTADNNVDPVYAFPVPWAPNSGNPADGTLAGGITFTQLPSEGTIHIYTVSGQRVRSLTIPFQLFPPQLKWDGRTEGGRDVVSGVYVWRIESGRNSKSGKLMIIR